MSNMIEINNLSVAIKKKVHSEFGKVDGRPFDTAVILHLYYPDLWDEIRDYLANLGNDFDLYISVCDTVKESDVAHIKKHYPDALICKMENRGRDIGPFMEIYPMLVDHYRYICKVHSKKSHHHPDGNGWRQDMYTKLLGSPKLVVDIKALFDCFPNIGIIGPEGQLKLCSKNLGENAERIIELARIMGANETGDFDYNFLTGSMFWFRPKALVPILSLNVKQGGFEHEQGQSDGTLAHALERVFSMAAKVAGYDLVTGTHIVETARKYFGAEWCHIQQDLVENQDRRVVFRKLAESMEILDDKDRELADRDHEINMFRNSSSWKLTAPLRRVKVLLSDLLPSKYSS